ncbi:Hsp70 family protein [Rhodococcus kronopolitis]|uniref:Hsp70 family protein n=1 Tax=Rhodococcus kronopolitis TaxID=1460226 RepID=A0ABV9FR21_9NOCA
MTAGLGLRVGDTTATAVLYRSGDPIGEPLTVVRNSTLQLGENESILGPPADRPGVLSRFVAQSSDPDGVVDLDGNSYRAVDLVATATSGLLMAAAVQFPDQFTAGSAPQTVATHPSHWDEPAVEALREALDYVGLESVLLVPDAVAAVAWLEATHGSLGDAVVAVYHLGSTGLDVSLVRTGADAGLLRPSTFTTRFGCDDLDRTVVEHVLVAVATELGPVDTTDPAIRAELTTLRERCRAAREQLSTQDSATVSVEVAGAHTSVTLTRAELDDMLRGPLTGALTLVEETVRAHDLDPSTVLAVLLAGGGATTPLLAELAAQSLAVAPVSAPQPGLITVQGAAILALGADHALLAAAGIAPTRAGGIVAAGAGAWPTTTPDEAGEVSADAFPSPAPDDAETDAIPVVTPDAGAETAWGAAVMPSADTVLPSAEPVAPLAAESAAESTPRGRSDRAVLIGVGGAIALIVAAIGAGVALMPRDDAGTDLPHITPVTLVTTTAVTTTTTLRPTTTTSTVPFPTVTTTTVPPTTTTTTVPPTTTTTTVPPTTTTTTVPPTTTTTTVPTTTTTTKTTTTTRTTTKPTTTTTKTTTKTTTPPTPTPEV